MEKRDDYYSLINKFYKRSDYVESILLEISKRRQDGEVWSNKDALNALALAATKRINEKIIQHVGNVDYFTDEKKWQFFLDESKNNSLLNWNDFNPDSIEYDDPDKYSTRLYEDWGHFLLHSNIVDACSVIRKDGEYSGVFRLECFKMQKFILSSDGLISQKNADLCGINRTGALGGFIIWPNEINRVPTLNQFKGRIYNEGMETNDRLDYCLKLFVEPYYKGKVSNLGDNTKMWLSLFKDNNKPSYREFINSFHLSEIISKNPDEKPFKDYYKDLDSQISSRTEAMLKVIKG